MISFDPAWRGRSTLITKFFKNISSLAWPKWVYHEQCPSRAIIQHLPFGISPHPCTVRIDTSYIPAGVPSFRLPSPELQPSPEPSLSSPSIGLSAWGNRGWCWWRHYYCTLRGTFIYNSHCLYYLKILSTATIRDPNGLRMWMSCPLIANLGIITVSSIDLTI